MEFVVPSTVVPIARWSNQRFRMAVRRSPLNHIEIAQEVTRLVRRHYGWRSIWTWKQKEPPSVRVIWALAIALEVNPLWLLRVSPTRTRSRA